MQYLILKIRNKLSLKIFPAALGFSINKIQNLLKKDLQNYTINLQNAIRDLRTCYDELINRFESFIQSELLEKNLEFEDL